MYEQGAATRVFDIFDVEIHHLTTPQSASDQHREHDSVSPSLFCLAVGGVDQLLRLSLTQRGSRSGCCLANIADPADLGGMI
jgi:hypothetical protein